jgi:molybdenum cofactor guanylyltransferase
MSIGHDDITAVILAGGQGRRMGGQDKGLIEIDGKPLAAMLIEQLRGQGVDIVINANRNHAQYRQFGYPVINDQLEDYQGPLAGFASAMSTVNNQFILTVPCDGPRLADDYVARFIAACASHEPEVLVAFDGERLQPVHAMIRVNLLSSLNRFLDSGERKIDRWYAEHDFQRVDFSDCSTMFRNINTPSDHKSLKTES